MSEYAHITLPEDFSAIVHAERVRQGLSQSELAKRSATSQRFVSEFERGKPSAEVGKVLAVLHALGLSVSVGANRTPEHNKALVQECVDRIAQELQQQSRPRKKLRDYLAELDE